MGSRFSIKSLLFFIQRGNVIDLGDSQEHFLKSNPDNIPAERQIWKTCPQLTVTRKPTSLTW